MPCFHWQALHLIGHSRVLIIREEHISADPQYPLKACSCVCVHEGTQALISDKKRSPQTTWKLSQPTQAGVYLLYVTMTVALIHSSLTGEQPAWGFNWESEQVLAVHQIGGLMVISSGLIWIPGGPMALLCLLVIRTDNRLHLNWKSHQKPW